MNKCNQSNSTMIDANAWCCFTAAISSSSSLSIRKRRQQQNQFEQNENHIIPTTSTNTTKRQYCASIKTNTPVLYTLLLCIIVVLSLEQDKYMSQMLRKLFASTATTSIIKSLPLASTIGILDKNTTNNSIVSHGSIQDLENNSEETAPDSETDNLTMTPQDESPINVFNINTTNDSTTTTSIFLFPPKPIRIFSILKQSIGINILKDAKKNPFKRCLPTVQYQLILQQASTTRTTIGETDEWVLQSLKYDNATSSMVPKTCGGDEIYVEWGYQNTVPILPVKDSSVKDTDFIDSDVLAVAQVTDNNDGTYTLKFIRPPILQYNISNHLSTLPTNDFGRLTIYYDYSCYLGKMYAPDKDLFKRAGEVHINMTQINVPHPYIHDFIPPNTNYTKIDLSQYDIIIAFGDSLIKQFVRQYTRGGYWSDNIRYKDNINQCISTIEDAQSAINKLVTWHDIEIQEAIQNNQTIALITGSAIWDAMRGCVREVDHLMEHQKAITYFLLAIHNQYPRLHIYWKSPSAIVLHRRHTLQEVEHDDDLLQRLRYISDTVPRTIYTVQKQLMQENEELWNTIGVLHFLDLYDAYYLSGPYSRIGDAVHYQDAISSLLFSYYYKGIDFHKIHYNNRISPKEAL